MMARPSIACADCGESTDENMIHLPLNIPGTERVVYLCRACCQRRWSLEASRSTIPAVAEKPRIRVKAGSVPRAARAAIAASGSLACLVHSVPSVAVLLDCSEASVWRMVKKKQLPVIHMGPGGGLTRIPDEAIRALIQFQEAS